MSDNAPAPRRFRSSGRYSALRLLREALTGHRGWKPAWRKAEPRKQYQVVIIGGGGHGLATAYYLANHFGITDVAVLEKGPIGLGNVGRNTTIIRSTYYTPENIRFYDFSLKLWEGLEQELNFNAMVSQRGVVYTYHTDGQRDVMTGRANDMRLAGADCIELDRAALKSLIPPISLDNQRFPVLGAFMQPRGGTVRHDAVAWGYARGASEAGVDIIEHCEVTGLRQTSGRITGVETTRGFIGADTVCLAVAGHSSHLASMAGIRLPIESHALQAFVSESIKPFLDVVLMFGAGHFYISQSDKGGMVFGGSTDAHNTYAQRGTQWIAQEVASEGVALLPELANLRILRQWGGIMDMTMDGTPIIGRLPLEGLVMNGGWCYGGFKAIPAGGYTTAHLIARGEPHPLTTHMDLERFADGRTFDEPGLGPFPWMH
jgi:sarcosine oxidase subunit beta